MLHFIVNKDETIKGFHIGLQSQHVQNLTHIQMHMCQQRNRKKNYIYYLVLNLKINNTKVILILILLDDLSPRFKS